MPWPQGARPWALGGGGACSGHTGAVKESPLILRPTGPSAVKDRLPTLLVAEGP